VPGYSVTGVLASVTLNVVGVPTVAEPVPEPDVVKNAKAAPATARTAITEAAAATRRFEANLRNMECVLLCVWI
jgi:hypothetical protein